MYRLHYPVGLNFCFGYGVGLYLGGHLWKVVLVDPEADSWGEKQIQRAEPGAGESLWDGQESPWKHS